VVLKLALVTQKHSMKKKQHDNMSIQATYKTITQGYTVDFENLPS